MGKSGVKWRRVSIFTLLKELRMNFIGEYTAKLDAKGRVLFPAALKRQLGESAPEEFVVNRGFETCLVLYPRPAWDAIIAKLQKLNPFKKENRMFIRQFNNGATPLTLDSAGRLLLPKELLQYAAVEADVYFSANGNKIEIWSKAQYESMMQIDPDEFAELAEKVMGALDLATDETI